MSGNAFVRERLLKFFFQVNEVLTKCKSIRRFSSCLNSPPIMVVTCVALFYFSVLGVWSLHWLAQYEALRAT